MKKICYFFIAIALFFSTNAYAREGWEGTFADEVRTDTIYFDGVLSSLDTDVQKALETIDELASSDSLDGVFWRLDGTNAPATGDFYTTANFGIGTAPSYPLHILKEATANLRANVSNATLNTALTLGYLEGVCAWAGIDSDVAANLTTGLYGLDAEVNNNGSGTVALAIGLYSGVWNNGSGEITTAYGLFIEPTTNSGTLHNNYGIYIGDQSGIGDTLNYSIYSAGGNNFFGGYTEIELADQDSPAVVTSFKVGTDDIYLEFTEADLDVFLPGLGKYPQITSTSDGFLGDALFLPQILGSVDYTGSGGTLIFINYDDYSSSIIYAYWNDDTWGDYLKFETDCGYFTEDVHIEGELSFNGDLTLAAGASINFNGGAYIDEFWTGSGYDISINSLQVDANTNPFTLRPAWHISGSACQYWDTVENGEDDSYLWQFRQYGDYQQGTSKPGSFVITSNGIMIGNGFADKDYYLKFMGETNSFEATWMEDEDYLLFADDIFIQAGETIKHDGTIGIEFQTVQSVWPFKFDDDSAAPNTGLYFNAGAGNIEFKYLDATFLASNVVAGALTIGNNTDNDVSLVFNATTDGEIAWRNSDSWFGFEDDILLADDGGSSHSIFFENIDQYIRFDGTDLLIRDPTRIAVGLGSKTGYFFNYGDTWFSFSGSGTPDSGCDFNVPYADDGSGFYIGYGATLNPVVIGANGTEILVNADGTASSSANWSFTGTVSHSGHVSMQNGINFNLGTSTGTKIGTATNQKLGFFNATPVIKPTSTTDLRTALINLGLYTTGGASPLNLNGGTLTAGNATIGSLTGMIKGTAGVLSAGAGGTDYEYPLTFSTGLTRTVNTITTNDSQINHDALSNFVAGEHFLQTDITNVDTDLATGLLKVTTGTGALSVITDNSSDWDDAFTHSEVVTGNPHSVTLEQARTAGATFAGAVAMGGYKLTGLGTCIDAGDAANKGYVDGAVSGLIWQDAVIDFWDASGGLPVSPDTGDRYICDTSGNGWTANYLYEYNGASWDEYEPDSGWATWVNNESTNYVYNGSDWVEFAGAATVHNSLTGLQGGTSGQYYHLTSAQATIATQAATTSLSGYLTDTDWDTFNNKEPAIAAGTTAQYYRGDKSWQTLSTAVLPLLSSTMTGLTYTSGTGVFSATSGYAIPTTTKQTQWDTAYTNIYKGKVSADDTTGDYLGTKLVGTANVITLTETGGGGNETLVFNAGSNLFNISTMDTDDISEGSTNLFYNEETVQDAVGGLFTDSNSINFTYTANTSIIADLVIQDTTEIDLTIDASGLKADLKAGSIVDSKLAAITTASKVNGSALYSLGSIDAGAGLIPNANIAAITTVSKVSGAALYLLGSIPAGGGTIPLANLPTITTAKGGTGLDSSGQTGIPKVTAGTWTFNATQDDLGDGTTYKQYNPANVAITGGSIEDVSLLSATTLTLDSALAIEYGGTGQITANAALNAFLPTQTGQTGKVLGTDGTDTSWVSIPSDDDFVDVTTNQSVGGIKTFTSFPVTPSSAPITDYQVANKKYVDDTAVEADTLADVTGRGAITTTAMTVAELQSTTTIGFDAEYDNGDSGATKTINFTNGNKQKITLTDAPCVFTFTAPAHPCSLTLKVVQGSGGSKTATWPATVKWPSGTILVLSTGVGAIDIVSFYYDGTNYYAVGNIGFS